MPFASVPLLEAKTAELLMIIDQPSSVVHILLLQPVRQTGVPIHFYTYLVMSNLWLQPDVPERTAVHLVLLRSGADQGPPHQRGTREPGQGQQGRPGGAVCTATGKKGGDQGHHTRGGPREPGQAQQGCPGGAVCTATGKEGG